MEKVFTLVTTLVLSGYVATSFGGAYAGYDYSTQHSLTVTPDAYFYEYKEPGLMKIEGLYYGANLDYMYSILPDAKDPNNPYPKDIKKLFAGLESRFAMGRVDYESNGTGSMDDIDDYVFETRIILGYEWKSSQSLSVSPYLGFGYRYLNNGFGGRLTTTGHWGYDRESNYFYLPIGARMAWPITGHTLLGGAIEFDLFFNGKQISHLEDGGVGAGTLENKQESGYGIRGSVFIEQEFKAVAVFIEPYIRYWDIDDSEVSIDSNFVFVGIEPANRTLETGLKLGIRF